MSFAFRIILFVIIGCVVGAASSAGLEQESLLTPPKKGKSSNDWLSHGLTLTNSRNLNDVTNSNPINSHTVKLLQSAWVFSTGAGSYNSATPALKGDVLYECSFDGSLYAINKFTGALIWKVR